MTCIQQTDHQTGDLVSVIAELVADVVDRA